VGGAQPAQYLGAVFAGQAEVQHHQGEGMFLQGRDRGLAVGKVIDRVAGAFQRSANGVGDCRIVLDHQHPHVDAPIEVERISSVQLDEHDFASALDPDRRHRTAG